jgi:hypothetical protein
MYSYWFGQYWLIVFCVTAGGLFGGLLNWTAGYLSSASPVVDGTASQPPTIFRKGISFLVANLYTGAGGAWGVLLAMLWAKRAPVDAVLTDRLELLATSIIAGYAGNRVLPLIADRLTKELIEKAVEKTQANADSAEASRKSAKESEKMAQSSLTAAQRAAKIAEINAYIARENKHSPGDSQRYIHDLEVMLNDDPYFRSASFALAALKWDLGDVDAALKVLTDFITAKNQVNAGGGHDTADAYWNIAWYCEEDSKKTGDAERHQQAVQAMVKSIAIDDPGFAHLRAAAEIKRALGLDVQEHRKNHRHA